MIKGQLLNTHQPSKDLVYLAPAEPIYFNLNRLSIVIQLLCSTLLKRGLIQSSSSRTDEFIYQPKQSDQISDLRVSVCLQVMLPKSCLSPSEKEKG